MPFALYHGIEVTEKDYQTFGTDVTVKISSAQEAKTVGLEMTKFETTVQGSYLGHNGKAGYKILANTVCALETKDVVFGSRMDNLFEHFKELEKIGIERFDENTSMNGQLSDSMLLNGNGGNGSLEELDKVTEDLTEVLITEELELADQIGDGRFQNSMMCLP